MRNTFGNNVAVTLFGESHGEVIGAVLDGMRPGLRIDYDLIEKRLSQRRGTPEISTSRRESDRYKIVSGVLNSVTTGAPICVLIENSDAKSGDYEKIKHTPRPSHADYTYEKKYNGYSDPRGGGRASGRLTAPLVAVGAICESALKEQGIEILTHIKRCEELVDADFADPKQDKITLEEAYLPVLDGTVRDEMKSKILTAKSQGDSVGAVLETAIFGVPAGVGEPWFDTLEGVIAHGIFSLPAVKGIEFGAGFAFSQMRGSSANDEMRFSGGEVQFLSNNSGGILGGISSGAPIIFRTAIKPTPSIAKKQRTVNLATHEDAEIEIGGRHDPFIAHKAAAAVTAMTAISLLGLFFSA